MRNARILARSGERLRAKPPGPRTGTRTGQSKFVALSAEVARRRDAEHVPLSATAARLRFLDSTVRRAYD